MAGLAGQQQYQCVNVYEVSDYSSPLDVLDWINGILRSELKRIEELANGVAYNQLLDLVFPGAVSLENVKFCTNSENEYIENFMIVQEAFKKIGCNKEIPIDRLVKSCFQDNFEFSLWFKKFFDVNYDGRRCNAFKEGENFSLRSHDIEQTNKVDINENDDNKQIAIVSGPIWNGQYDGEAIFIIDDKDKNRDTRCSVNFSLIDHSWSKKILRLVGNKARLMESFSWLSTVGGGYSSLGERDTNFSARAGALSLGQQLKLAELLGDDRLEVMCHLFAALAALQLDNRHFCINYVKNVIIPLMKRLPYRDPILTNMLRHICFRAHILDRFTHSNAIEGRNSENGKRRY